ncbi:MAG: HAD-IA family hydrolase, partial [Bacteroidota bacterium]
ALDSCRKYKLPIGLATSSPTPVIEAVLKKLDISRYFDTIVSAEKLSFGKPHPEVFLNCAKKLNVESQSCLVLEDSVNGVIAGKAGLMTVVAVPEERNFHDYRYSIADFKIKTLN